MTAQLIGTLVPTKIPGYADTADIQAALKVYHYGSYDFDTAETDKANLINPSIAYTLSNLQDQITNLPTSIKASDYNTKGVILSASSASVISKLTVGSDGQNLVADSTTSSGLKWADPLVTPNNEVTLTGKTLTAPIITLSTVSSTADARIFWDTTNKKLKIGDGLGILDFVTSAVLINAATITSNNYNITLSDRDKLVELNSSSAGTVTIPLNATNAFPIGSQVHLHQTSTGQFTIAAESGVIVNATPGLKLRAQWSFATLIKRGENLWSAVGDLSA